MAREKGLLARVRLGLAYMLLVAVDEGGIWRHARLTALADVRDAQQVVTHRRIDELVLVYHCRCRGISRVNFQR